MHSRTRIALVSLITLLITFCLADNCAALNFADFSSTVTSNFESDPFAGNRLIAGASLIVFGIMLYAAVKVWKRQTDEAVDRHYEIVKQRHEAYLEALRTGKGQKRQWFRLYSPVEFEWLPPHRPSQGKRPKFKQDRLNDVSAGGIGFSTVEVLEAGDQVKIILYTGEGSPLYLNGHVVRVIADENSAGMISHVGVAFDDLTDSDHDMISAWIIKRQRDQILEKAGHQPKEDVAAEELVNHSEPAEYEE